jgi:hypothetical protein
MCPSWKQYLPEVAVDFFESLMAQVCRFTDLPPTVPEGHEGRFLRTSMLCGQFSIGEHDRQECIHVKPHGALQPARVFSAWYTPSANTFLEKFEELTFPPKFYGGHAGVVHTTALERDSPLEPGKKEHVKLLLEVSMECDVVVFPYSKVTHLELHCVLVMCMLWTKAEVSVLGQGRTRLPLLAQLSVSSNSRVDNVIPVQGGPTYVAFYPNDKILRPALREIVVEGEEMWTNMPECFVEDQFFKKATECIVQSNVGQWPAGVTWGLLVLLCNQLC